MQRDDIISMARDVGLSPTASRSNKLVMFAAIVAAFEREKCAKVCEEFYSIEGIAQECAAAILARKDNQ